jgi:aminoglycoside 3-N-acetyltransferase
MSLNKKVDLFISKKGNVTNHDFLRVLLDLGANNTDILYIHSALNFGAPNKALKKSEILECLAEVLLELHVDTLILPTYTFSFCNNERFDINATKTPMGVLNEYFRINVDSVRSCDPLMSNILIGKNDNLVNGIRKNSVGLGSTFDLLAKSNKVIKFLFMGPRIGDCFTYMHYIEADQKVPYRYYRDFSGTISKSGLTYEDTYSLFIRYENVLPGGGSYVYENILHEKKLSNSIQLGESKITVVEKNVAHSVYLDLLNLSPNFFIDEPFNTANKINDFKFRKMVAL